MNNKVKILVSYKDEHPYIKSDIIIPIQTGRAIAEREYEGMIGDDTGDNISSENDKYNELSAQYWAWKNQDKLDNPDYIGFMHYRRHLLFDEELPRPEKTWLNGSDFYMFGRLDEEYLQYFRDEKIQEMVEQYDIIVPKAYDFANNKFTTVKENYRNLPGQNIENYELMLNAVKLKHPEMKKAVAQFEKGRYEYICNIYILRKDIFDEYSTFLFEILATLNNAIDFSHYSWQGYRVLGYLGEMLFNIFLYYYVETHPDVRIKGLDMGSLHSAELQIHPKPAFDEYYTAIVVPCSNYYAPYLSVYIQSLIDCSSLDHNYDIIVLQDDISDINKEKLKANMPKNFSLRFINVTSYFDNINLKSSKDYLSINSYYRLVIPKVMVNYKRVIVTDIDLIFKHDISLLDKIDMGNYPIASCIEPQEGINLNINPDEWNYSLNVLKLDDPYRYFNTGVMVINLDAFTQDNVDDMLKMIDCKYRCHEQCILNSYFKDRILELSPKWNHELTLNKLQIKNSMPMDMYKKYYEAEKDPCVLHWIGVNKPWKSADVHLGYLWWEIARKTNYYEEILMRYSEILAIRTVNRNKNKGK